MPSSKLIRTLTAAAAAVLAAGCSQLTLGSDSLDEHQTQWSSQHLADYRYDYQRTCFCTPAAVKPVTIEVRGGKVAHVYDRGTTTEVAGAGAAWPTITDLFAEIEQARAAHTAPLVVRWDEQRGYPVYVEIGTLANDAGSIETAGNLAPL
jgi:hypothetical protein